MTRLSVCGAKHPRFEDVDAPNRCEHNARNWRLEECPFALLIEVRAADEPRKPKLKVNTGKAGWG